MNYAQMVNGLNSAINNFDTEYAHQKADEILVEVALHTGLSKQERKKLVALYNKVKKWYA